MSRHFYTEYIRHCLRFYCRRVRLDSKQPIDHKVDRDNWEACHKVVSVLSDDIKEAIISIYEGRDTLADEVYNASQKYNVEQNTLWDAMKKIERDIAVVRGLAR